MSAPTQPRRRRRAPARRRSGVAPADVPQDQLDPITAIFEAIASRERQRYVGAGVRIGSSRVIHAKVEEPWMRGLGVTVPAPACHAGFGIDQTRLSPARGEVTCGRCLRVRGGGTPPPYTGQEPLF